MATSINDSSQTKQSACGFLLICGDLISNEQRKEICSYVKQAFQRIDRSKFNGIEHLLNNLIRPDEFQADSQYRQIANGDNGSLAGFLYLPQLHTVLNVLRDFFNSCHYVTIIFCGQQIDSNGAWILSDSLLSPDHIHSLFVENPSFAVQDLHLVLPLLSHLWTRLSTNYLQKRLKYVQLDDCSAEANEENAFGKKFYESLIDILTRETVNFDIYTKLVPRDSSGTIAFDEPNLYILYGQQGEASLFGIRGFVVLINGGFSRTPSFWNLIRGLQTIDTCILTHFDYGVLPGLQSLLHRKTIPMSDDGRLCKPDIRAIFVNQTQRARLQSSPSSKATSSSKLANNLSHNIDQFYGDIKKLNIDTFDLVKHITPNKPAIEPINLYKKIAFGSLDLYVLHPTSLSVEDEKTLATVQKIPIRDQQPSPSVIPPHHWYSSCTLLTWTPTSKSSKDSPVRILYTGACPQTLVFEALTRVRHLELLHEPPQQPSRPGSARSVTSTNGSAGTKSVAQKSKLPTSSASSDAISTTKGTVRPVAARVKPAPATTVKAEKPRSGLPSTAKKVPISNKKGPSSQVTKSKSATPLGQVNGEEGKSEQPSDELDSSNNDDPDDASNVATQDEDSINDQENELQRPGFVSFTNDTQDAFVESNAATPIDEINTHLTLADPMTISFVDGAPNTRNPFLDKAGVENENIDIVHHGVPTVAKNTMPSIEEIQPQGLPMDEANDSKKTVPKKTTNGTHRTSAPTIPVNHLRKSKQTVPSGPIFYVDVAYIPYYGNEHYVDSEFFRRIRARYYVLNCVEINRLTLESLIDGKQQWDKQEQTPVTLVPTSDGEQLRQFFVMHKARLTELNINILPASTRCNVQYDDEGSPAQRLRFSANQHLNEQ